MTLSQWDCLLKHLGAWQGSFARLSPSGVLKEDVPSLVTLEGLNQNQTMRQTIRYFSAETQAMTQEKVLEYSSLSRSTLFHETGAFSQGSIQFSPYGEFGAEFGFVEADRRLRLVQLFQNGQFNSITLIREQRQGTNAPERPHLSVEQLIGDWQGEAVTLYADLRNPETYATTLSIWQDGDRLHQRLAMPNREMTSTAKIDGSQLHFDQGRFPVQVLLLPDGASCNTPLTVPRGQPFVIETGWLLAPNLRHRLVRSYDAQGGWSSLTLVVERNSR
jgi:hypothetical protein